MPEWDDQDLSDQELAARLCAECEVRRACLELDLRTVGADAFGVWGGLSDEDRRALHPVWRARRNGRGGQS
ncbi:WhiB family transcriptional regulator [Saccharothrix australiensis]|uniref:Transcription factor WhiB n=1 Tax=Saccharothrix australiensis TaxID=2072 RepID=A0A495VZI6_9PSEU|nr:transcription factor WhiB [Saccharothrix australiensis]